MFQVINLEGDTRIVFVQNPACFWISRIVSNADGWKRINHISDLVDFIVPDGHPCRRSIMSLPILLDTYSPPVGGYMPSSMKMRSAPRKEKKRWRNSGAFFRTTGLRLSNWQSSNSGNSWVAFHRTGITILQGNSSVAHRLANFHHLEESSVCPGAF